MEKNNKTKGKQYAGATKVLPSPFTLATSFAGSGFRLTSETAGFCISASVINVIRPYISAVINTEQHKRKNISGI